MFAKLLVIIMFVGATACALLVIRQQRIDTFHEISVVHQHLLTHERTLWELRGEIAERCRPSQVRLVMNQLGGQWAPIPARPDTLHPSFQVAQRPPQAPAPIPVAGAAPDHGSPPIAQPNPADKLVARNTVDASHPPLHKTRAPRKSTRP